MKKSTATPLHDSQVIKHTTDNNRFEIWEQSDTGHKALHSVKTFGEGEILDSFGARLELKDPNYLSVQVSPESHIMLDPEYLQYMNHSCQPNVFLDTKIMEIRALVAIRPGDELTFFYPSTEWSMAQGFACHCNSRHCLKYIQGAAHLSEEVLQDYHLSEHIEGLLREKIPGADLQGKKAI
jgi:hypothetical protein